MLQRSYQPLLATARFPRPDSNAKNTLPVEFWIVNDAPLAREGCRMDAHLDGRLVWSVDGIGVRPGQATHAGDMEIAMPDTPERLEVTLLSSQQEILSYNDYDLGVQHPDSAPPWMATLVHQLGARLIGG